MKKNMKLVGKKWGQLSEDQQYELLRGANPFECKEGDCIIDLNEYLSVAGRVINTEHDYYIEVEDDAIIYNPEEGSIILNEKFKGLITLKDASVMFNKEESTLRRNISNGVFIEHRDCIKFGTTWVFDIDSLKSFYENR